MSIVTVQLGQCGNQIGGQMFSTLAGDLNSSCPGISKAKNSAYSDLGTERFFCLKETGAAGETQLQARAVLVDMESKVIAQTLTEAKQSGTWQYPDKQQFCQKRGSGNNWAHGFCSHGPKARENIMNLVRREVEKCDGFGGFLTLLSLAGGTGSGVGTFVTECLRDEYPHSFILNQVVWPFDTGEVIVQNYNAVLTLSHLYQSSDAVLTMENDSLQRICSQLQAIKKVSFKDINNVISHKLASILQPVYPSSQEDSWNQLVTSHLGDMLQQVVPQPQYKLLTVQNIPQMSETALKYSSYQWHGLLKHLRQMLIANAAMEEGINWQVKAIPGSWQFNKSVANLLILRGKDLATTDTSSFYEPNLYSSWCPPQFACQTWAHPRPVNQYEKSAVLLSNSQSHVGALDRVVDKAWTMFASRAYVHQYQKHGLTEDDFVDSFACLEQIIKSYEQL